MRTIEIPELALVALIGASGSGKSTLARRHFLATEVLSSDSFRGLVSDDENDQTCTHDAFDALYYMLDKRLARGKLSVVDATNVRSEDRKRLIEHARKYHCFAVAVVVNTSERVCQERNANRPDRDFGPYVIRRQILDLKLGIRGLEREGFRYVHVLDSSEEIEVRRLPLRSNKKHEKGPFDIFGDLHGCAGELRALLKQSGWEQFSLPRQDSPWGEEYWRHPFGRKAIFLGDLVDRGPFVLDTLRIVHNMVAAGTAFCVAGNHDVKFLRWLRGKQVQIKHGLERSIAEVEPLASEDRNRIASFLDGLVSHYVLDGGRLVVAHGGLREEMHGRNSGAVREFCLYGETTGEIDEFGLPVRYNWASEYRGRATVVYGHTPVPEVEWLNNTVNIDTGAVFGGKLTMLRYPEREFVSVPSAREYCPPIRPFVQPKPEARTSQQELDDVLDLEDITGKRIVETRLQRTITIREENSIAALEVMSRFAIDPHWLIYLPPTMSPSETSSRPEYLEYPTEAFEYFRRNGIQRVVCEEKHMGSRAVVAVCRDLKAARERFGVIDGRVGVCYTRTGRAFFPDPAEEAEFILRVQTSLTQAGFWEEFHSDWFCLDCELLPWSAKARELIQRQYAAVGAAGIASLEATIKAIQQSPAAVGLSQTYEQRLGRLRKYREAYRRYCWPVTSLTDYRLAPFHLLASERAVHTDKTNRWHMDTLNRLAACDPGFIIATPFLEVDLTNDAAIEHASCWWEDLTSKGGEGMVVKPLEFIAHGPKGLVQPAIKCRGREYLRIIYGPEYTADDQLPRLRSRGLSGKRSLGAREFALGIEALERFASREPLRRVHECVFGILALESEPVDPRL
ncbi:MAG TPA: polynucleotide kinase-phosphatase [Bryobacteraceae bacterium]|jgi:protein phosphatase|nr:polynucleotide kinase-phosphatase [Bryobacteraceae bacterium]